MSFEDAGFKVGARVAERYVLKEKLGSGGSGSVFLARDDLLGREVALKLVPEGDASSWEEARLATRVTHEGFPRVYDVGQTPGWQFLVMELVGGEALQQRLDRVGRLSTAETVRVVSQLAAALDAAHERDVVHCDVKPSNVVLQDDGRARMVDFGAARRLGATPEDADIVALSPLWVAPEIARGAAVDRRTDVYSLGALTYAMLTGRPPFSGRDADDLVRKRLVEDPARPSAFRPDLGDPVDAVVLGALDRNPERRFSTAPAFASALRAAYEGSLDATRRVAVRKPLALPLAGQLRASTATLLQRWQWRAMGAAVVLALLVGAAWLALPWVAPAPFCARGTAPSFGTELSALRGRLGGVMGSPRECAHPNPDNGDLLQATSHGLAFIRRGNQLPYFTTGPEHWTLSPRGLLYWTGDSVDPPRNAAIVPPENGQPRP